MSPDGYKVIDSVQLRVAMEELIADISGVLVRPLSTITIVFAVFRRASIGTYWCGKNTSWFKPMNRFWTLGCFALWLGRINQQDIDKNVAAALLRYFRWNKETLIDNYYGDPETTKRKAGVAHFTVDFQISTEPRVCRICVDDCAPENVISLGCKHFFCKPCFKEYLVNKVRVLWHIF